MSRDVNCSSQCSAVWLMKPCNTNPPSLFPLPPSFLSSLSLSPNLSYWGLHCNRPLRGSALKCYCLKRRTWTQSISEMGPGLDCCRTFTRCPDMGPWSLVLKHTGETGWGTTNYPRLNLECVHVCDTGIAGSVCLCFSV